MDNIRSYLKHVFMLKFVFRWSPFVCLLKPIHVSLCLLSNQSYKRPEVNLDRGLKPRRMYKPSDISMFYPIFPLKNVLCSFCIKQTVLKLFQEVLKDFGSLSVTHNALTASNGRILFQMTETLQHLMTSHFSGILVVFAIFFIIRWWGFITESYWSHKRKYQ